MHKSGDQFTLIGVIFCEVVQAANSFFERTFSSLLVPFLDVGHNAAASFFSKLFPFCLFAALLWRQVVVWLGYFWVFCVFGLFCFRFCLRKNVSDKSVVITGSCKRLREIARWCGTMVRESVHGSRNHRKPNIFFYVSASARQHLTKVKTTICMTLSESGLFSWSKWAFHKFLCWTVQNLESEQKVENKRTQTKFEESHWESVRRETFTRISSNQKFVEICRPMHRLPQICGLPHWWCGIFCLHSNKHICPQNWRTPSNESARMHTRKTSWKSDFLDKKKLTEFRWEKDNPPHQPKWGVPSPWYWIVVNIIMCLNPWIMQQNGNTSTQ